MSWRSVSLTACSAALLAAGCGGGDRLPVLTALRLERLAARHDCRALVREAVAAVNRGEVPPALQEQVVSDANACRLARRFRP